MILSKGQGIAVVVQRKPKVLSKGKQKLCQAKIVIIKSKTEKMTKQNVHVQTEKILFFRG